MKYIKLIIISLLLGSSACNEDEFLKEIPIDLYTSDISYKTPNDIVMTITEMHRLVKAQFDGSHDYTYMFIGTDVAMSPRNATEQIGYGGGTEITPENRMIALMWNGMYLVIKNANLVLDRINKVNYPSETLNPHCSFMFAMC